MIRVLIVDDHEIMRKGLCLVFEYEDDFELVGEACDADDAIAKAEETRPDVVLMDIRMPGKNGIEASKEIREIVPGAKIMVLTAVDDEEDIFSAIESGVDGYMLKSVGGEQLAEAVRLIAAGQSYLHPSIARKVMERLSHKPPVGPPKAQMLTAKESLVLKLMAEGFKNKEIAGKLFLSEETVKSHVSHILAKLNQTDRMQAVLYALRHNLVALEPERIE